MKKFKFYTCNDQGKIIAASNGYFDVFRKLPTEFTVQDIMNEPAFSKTVKTRAPKMREGTMIQISRLCGWSSRSGGAEYLYIKCIGDSSKIEALRDELEKVSSKIDGINKQIEKLAGSLIDDLKALEKVKKSLRDQIKSFEETGIL